MIPHEQPQQTAPTDRSVDALVIGSGFAGAVTACRLVEAGFRVGLLERGQRYEQHDFPTYPTEHLLATAEDLPPDAPPTPDFSRWLWRYGQGIYDVRDLGDAVSIQAAGYGGGSLIYANVHLRPPHEVFDAHWPDAYRNGALDPYFDLAAYMLRVSPIPVRLAKTLQLQRAAEALNGSDRGWFRVPLAINFDGSGPNDYGRPQEPCDMRGRCTMGCDRQAKNTLDLTYLARAEDGAGPPEADPQPALVRTLAEVTTIERHGDGFLVTYRDHLALREDSRTASTTPAERTVAAKYVFLCAGAVNTTELLLKNAEALGLQAEQRRPLGSHYFPNADSLAAVYDCEDAHEADYGPTITAAVLHDSRADGPFSRALEFRNGTTLGGAPPPVAGMTVVGKESGATAVLAHDPVLDWGDWTVGATGTFPLEEAGTAAFQPGEPLAIGPAAIAVARTAIIEHQHWFLAEDGGLPPDASPLAGIFRSPLWLRRNRYREETHDGQGMPPLMRAAPARPAAHRLRLGGFVEALGGTANPAGVPRGVVTGGVDAPRGVAATHGGSHGVPPDVFGAEVGSFFPAWFGRALADERSAIAEQASAMALPIIGRMLDDLAANVAGRLDHQTVTRFSLGIAADDSRKEVLVRGILRQALQVLAGSEADVAAQAARVLLDPLPSTPGGLLDMLGMLLLWAAGYGASDAHTGVILTMGRDLYRGRLSLDRTRSGVERLRATLPHGVLDISASMQERALRAVASRARGWRGELRTNPAWSALGRRITVHSQGGCPMHARADEGVTDPAGQVHGCAGLYVMDAAAFPTSVGVNPSATIAAIAEYKIEAFIRAHRPAWRSADGDAAQAWWAAPGRRDALDPLNRQPRAESRAPEAEVLGLTFDEQLRGFVTDVPGDPASDPPHPMQIAADTAPYTAAEARGSVAGTAVRASLRATVHDLARLVAAHAHSTPAPISLTGTVTFEQPAADVPGSSESATYTVAHGTLEMFLRPPHAFEPPIRFFRYRLDLVPDAGGRPLTLSALKVLRNDSGNDLWHDTATTYLDILGDGRLRRGVLRVPFNEFLQVQLPGMEITGTNDPTRRSWALVAFYRFFARQLAEIYMVRAEEFVKLFVSAVSTIHV